MSGERSDFFLGHAGADRAWTKWRLMDAGYTVELDMRDWAVYDEAVKQLEQAGAGFGSVPGRIFHCATEAGGTIQVGSRSCGGRW